MPIPGLYQTDTSAATARTAPERPPLARGVDGAPRGEKLGEVPSRGGRWVTPAVHGRDPELGRRLAEASRFDLRDRLPEPAQGNPEGLVPVEVLDPSLDPPEVLDVPLIPVGVGGCRPVRREVDDDDDPGR